MADANKQVIVVGGGLAGLSAAHTIYEQGGNVVVLDKSAFFGGNSTKATSGINGAGTAVQRANGINDNPEVFYDDTAKSARDRIRPALVRVLTYQSGSAVEWLQSRFGLDLSLTSRLGGHSFPRTHRGKEKFPGMTITYALMEKLEELAASEPHRVRAITKAHVTKLIKDGERVVGAEYEKPDESGEMKVHREYGPVILATGGYAADFTTNSLLKKHRPDIYDYPTTNGDYSTGDGIKMTIEAGGNTVDLEKVQVHPTGLVDPSDTNAKVKFLAAEALRGVGGILVNAEGKRFVDEMNHRDYVTAHMEKTKGPIRLVLNKKAASQIEWHCKHYIGRGVMKKFANGAAVAREMGVSPKVLEETFRAYNEAARTKKDPYGRKYFDNVPFEMNEEYYVSWVTPVLHFTMGGIEINDESQVLAPGGRVVPGLFAAGETAGGVHGANRLGGSSLLGCVVYGRVSGCSAARYLLQNLLSRSAQEVATDRVASIAGHLNGPRVVVEMHPEENRVAFNVVFGSSATQTAAATPTTTATPAAPAAASKPAAAEKKAEEKPMEPKRDPNKPWTMEDVAEHNKPDDCWVVVNGRVLDVTKFLPDHPGGRKSILTFAGRDATEEFNMLHKPDVVDKYAPYAVIGVLKK